MAGINKEDFGTLMDYDIVIKPTKNKMLIVKVGCGTFAFNTVAQATNFIEHYVENPQEIRDAVFGPETKMMTISGSGLIYGGEESD